MPAVLAIFVLGIANFAMHKAVLESRHQAGEVCAVAPVDSAEDQRWFEGPSTLWDLACKPIRRGGKPNALHVALARSEVSDVRTRETEIRPEMRERSFDALVLAEGSGRPELEVAVPEIERAIIGSGVEGVRNAMVLL